MRRAILIILFVLAAAQLGSPAAHAQQEQSRTRPEVWAILIGIDRYEDPAIPGCKGAVRDARELRQWLVRTAGWSSRNVLLFHDAGNALPAASTDQPADLKPLRDNLNWAIDTWLKPRLKPGDLVVIYYAGQAAGLPQSPRSPAREFLLPIDAKASDLLTTGWVLEDVLDSVASNGQNTVICWLDTSLHGRGTAKVAGADPSPSATRWLHKVARWPGVSAWLAADGHPAAEAENLAGHSPLAGALLDGLGSPERPQNLLACLDRLHHQPALARQGFRSVGGVAPDLILWSKSARARAVTEPVLMLQRGHADRVEALALSADGDRMVTASWDSTVKVWRTSDRMLLRTLPGYLHLAGVTGLALDPGGQWLASGDGMGRIRAWDLVQNREKALAGAPPHTSRIMSLSALADGQHFVSVDQDGKAYLWDASAPNVQGKPLGEQTSAIACASLPGPVCLALARDTSLRLFGPDGQPIAKPGETAGNEAGSLAGPGRFITSLALAPDGRWLAAGDEKGSVIARPIGQDGQPYQHDFGSEIGMLTFAPGVGLIIGTNDGLVIHPMEKEGGDQRLDLSGPVRQVTSSADGRWLAACTQRGGEILLWRLEGQQPAQPIALPEAAGKPAVSLAFAPDGRTLWAGGQDGAIRSWDLGGSDVQEGPSIPARRGKVASLSVSNDRRYLLQITRDWSALLWDLQDGRGFLPVDGRWTAGTISPDGSLLALVEERSGDVSILDRATGQRVGKPLPRPAAQSGPGASALRFGPNNVSDGDRMLAFSPDGRWLAACSSEGPLACVWDVKTGGLVATIRNPEHTQPLAALDFSADSKRLLTADAGGVAKVWQIPAAGQPARKTAEFSAAGVPITAARIVNAEASQVVLGTRDGRVLLFTGAGAQAATTLLRLQGQVRSLATSNEGRWLAVGGSDKSVRLVQLDGSRQATRPDVQSPHAEQVNTLITWPGGGMFVSGSDDTTVRFWNVAGQGLRGVLSAVQEPRAGVGLLDTSWVAYTPQGLFDGSPGGESQVTWLRGGEVVSLEQYFTTSRVYGLADWLRQGKEPPRPAPEAKPGPRLAIDEPGSAVVAKAEATYELTINLAETGLDNLRLYQNGVPVQADVDWDLKSGQHQVKAMVTLRKGTNRFYAMASKPGSIDGRSNEVEIRFAGAEPPAQLHVLALGVSNYKKQALQFAHLDAQQIAEYLVQHGVQAPTQEGSRTVLVNAEVTNERVDKELQALQKRVKSRPQDTIVVFLAGHTNVLQERFCLLLPTFEFPEGAPAVAARRGPQLGAGASARADDKTTLTYVKIYRNIARMGALQRLIIIDACQSEAIFDDPGVRLIRRYIDNGAQQARTSYIMAARRGEPANEVAALKHGLLSYVLLRGMGDSRLEPVPGVSVFDEWPNADMNRDRLVTTEELRRFANLVLPRLANQFPEVVERQGPGNRLEPVHPTANLHQAPRLQTEGSRSFPLVEIQSKKP